MRKIAVMMSVASIALSSWLYWGSDLKLEQEISSREWQSKTVTVIEHTKTHQPIGPLRRVDILSNVKYLPNGTYSRVSNIVLYAENDDNAQNIMNISETGKWDVSDGYLLVTPAKFRNVSQSQNQDFTAEELELVTQIFKMDAQQSRRVDIVNDYTLLLTSLNHGSTVLFSN
ncbi:MAG: regulatory protein ToxS [Vibrio sp.]|uniref:regulatory protein ToxS n=1 Tax=Vibrio sp. TaxID=678 RepID=UPI003A8C42C8